MNNISWSKTLDILKVTSTYIINRCNINDAIMSDSEIITMSLIGGTTHYRLRKTLVFVKRI